MPLIVEDGTGKEDASAYVDVAFADDYFNFRSNSNWTGTTQEKESWIVRATDYIELRFALLFLGEKKNPRQALSFPRKGLKDIADDVVPNAVKRACCEYAVRAKNGPLAPDIARDDSGFVVKHKREKLGPIEEETRFQVGASGQPQLLFPIYPEADFLLLFLLADGMGGRKVVRN